MISKPIYFSERTAIARKFPAKPIQELAKLGYIKGLTLYHGRGKDFPGLELIKSIVGNNQTLEYEPSDITPTFMSQCPKVDTILSIYVLNVIDPHDRAVAYREIWDALKVGGCVYFAVRGQDSAYSKAAKTWTRHMDGFISSYSTFQKFYSTTELLGELNKHFHSAEIVSGTDKSSMIIAKATRKW